MTHKWATYRLQLTPRFGFKQATEVVDYLANLGVSHLYTSPYLQAAKGSLHGYDVVDPSHVNQELGGEKAHRKMCAAIQNAALSHMIDLVPNHMSISGKENPWWWDVLENGPSSRFASYFDVDWEASEERWQNQILLPVLGDHYGRVLENGELRLSFDRGLFTLRYYDQAFPIDPSTLSGLLSRAAADRGLQAIASAAENLAALAGLDAANKQFLEKRHRKKQDFIKALATICNEENQAKTAIDREVARMNTDSDALDALIESQHYRLAFWRCANRDLGYRRFFDIKDLAGLRVEEAKVFQDTHKLSISWVRKGWVQALRVDHPDGLRNPATYFKRLKEACPNTWIIAEKILERHEQVPRDWPIDGTVGYDFLNAAGGLFIDPEGEKPITQIYEEFTGEKQRYPDLVRDCKRQVLTEILASELNRLTTLFIKICGLHRRHRDYTRKELRDALCETAVNFPVYRSYVSASNRAAAASDIEYVNRAIEDAMEQRPDLDPLLFRFLNDVLLLRVPGTFEAELAMRFQQLTPPVMAKGVEDTAFYRYFRLVSLNEVGGDPSKFGTTLEEFHNFCQTAQKKRPLSLLSTTTHDTKRSEDFRMRLSVLSEIPQLWKSAVESWSAINEKYRTLEMPDRNTEYLLYQTLAGAWPIGQERLSRFLLKAAREAKVHTSWTAQNEEYENALLDFSTKVLEDKEFLASFSTFIPHLIFPGRLNSLSQTLIKMTSPGIPDIYQGTELWDLSLVDPDNRREVDFSLRTKLLFELNALQPEQVLDQLDAGLPKLWIIHKALQLRKKYPELLGPKSSYRPLYAQGRKKQHAVAFIRGEKAVALAPRLTTGIQDGWQQTFIELPKGSWNHILTGEIVEGGKVLLEKLLFRFPAALLVKCEKRGNCYG